MSDWRTRAENLAPWLAGLLLASPVLIAFYPPMTDLPFHEAAFGLLRHRNDATLVPPGLYLLNLGEPNQLFYLLGWPLSYVVSTRWAAKLIVAAAVLAIPVAGARVARHAGTSRLAALLVAPMGLGWLFSWGLVANLLGLAALLVTLPWLDRFAKRPTLVTTLAALAAVPLLYLAHEAMMFVYGGAAVLLALVYPWSPLRTGARLLPAALVAGIHEVFIHWVQQFVTPNVRAVPVLWHSIAHKLERVPYIVLPVTEPIVQLSVFALCLLTLAMLLRLRHAEKALATGADEPVVGSRLEHVRAFAWRHRWAFFAGACFGLYLAFPYTLSGSTLVYQRFFPPGYAVFVVLCAPRDLWTHKARVARFSLLALPIGTLLIGWPSFVDSNRQYEALEQILPFIEPGHALAEVDLGPGDPTRSYSLGPAYGRVLATKGGRLAYSFTDSPIYPMVIAQPYQWNEALHRFASDTWLMRPEHDAKLFTYILVRTNDPNLQVLAALALRRETQYVTGSGEWVLFRSRAAVIPPTSPEPPMADPAPPTLRDGVNAIVATMRGDARSPVPSILEPSERSF